jgi:hypothetical protein
MMADMKKRQRRVAIWTVVVVVIVLLAAGGFALAKWKPAAWRAGVDFVSGVTPPPAGWVPYRNTTYGFSLFYPPNWQVVTSTLESDPPAVLFGNPATGTTTYTLRLSIEKNPDQLSSSAYVAQMLADVKARDEAAAAIGPAPQTGVMFASATAFSVDSDQAYELNNVFEFDHQGEQIYFSHGSETLLFDFPTFDQNPNIANPAANNAIAHQIFGTLTFIK